MAELKSIQSSLESRRDLILDFLSRRPDYDGVDPADFAANPVQVFNAVKQLNLDAKVMKQITEEDREDKLKVV